ncbi:hypothetical protein [Vibrio phage RYC]|nr:hypothetical protein [Vibrio phage RYC]
MKMVSRVDYFDIVKGQEVVVLEFCPVKQIRVVDDRGQQELDYYKVLPKEGSDRVHYLFAFELE